MLQAEFTIDFEGRPNEIVVVMSEPPGLLNQAAIRQVMNSRFRPRIADGNLIESTGTIGWDYQYRSR